MTDIDWQAASAPSDVYRIVAAARAQRWGYVKTLDAFDLAKYIHQQSEDPNVRADADMVWREALRAFHPRAAKAIEGGTNEAFETQRGDARPTIAAMYGALHSVWLHGDWRWLTRNMTTEQREAAADAVERHSATLDHYGQPGDDMPLDLRWWRT